MKVKKLHHVAVAVSNIEAVMDDFARILDMPRAPIQEVQSQAVKGCLIPIGDTEIELIQPTDPSSGVSKFLEKRGEALHHICFQVGDVNETLKELEGKGMALIDKQARPGLAGMVGFIHPRSTQGTLIELCHPVPGKGH